MPLETIYDMLSKRRVRKAALTDEELAEKLSVFPDWNSREHADLSSVDYSQYKPYKSTKTKEIISKWL